MLVLCPSVEEPIVNCRTALVDICVRYLQTKKYNLPRNTGPQLRFQITAAILVQHRQFTVHRIDVKIVTYLLFAKCLKRRTS